MEIRGIKYTAPLFDNSGYAKASRENVLSLYKLGIPIKINPISFEKARPELGEDGEILRSLINKDVDYNVNIIHTTPEFWKNHKEDGVLNCGYTIWETDRLHPSWPNYINNNVDMCMVGCQWNVDIFKKSGVIVPIFNVPHVIDTVKFDGIGEYNIKGLSDDTFMFYSIFQWHERKNPIATIRAYWRAFMSGEDVALVLKTYRSDYSDQEKDAVRKMLINLKRMSPSVSHPKIYLIPDMLSEDEMLSLHRRGDCYVSLDRGEGFGLSTAYAGCAGNPVVSTGFGGVTEYLNKENSYLVDYILTPVAGMPWSPWYLMEQSWAEADIIHGAELMRKVYDNREEASNRGKKLKEYLQTGFNYSAIGNKIVDAISSM
jgi:glycosyltransferase involved in cell wall biosynthesis